MCRHLLNNIDLLLTSLFFGVTTLSLMDAMELVIHVRQYVFIRNASPLARVMDSMAKCNIVLQLHLYLLLFFTVIVATSASTFTTRTNM